MDKKKKIVLIVLGILLLIISGILIYYFVIKNGQENIDNNDSATEQLEVPEVSLPTFTIQNNSEYLTDTMIQDAFEKYYPYYVYFLGEPNDFGRGLNWVWDSTLESWDDYEKRGIDNFVSATNTVYLGRATYMDSNLQTTDEMQKKIELDRLGYGFMHETAHLFFQYNKEPISFDFGQWIWEGEALIAENLTRRALGDMGSSTTNYDINNRLGSMVNGTLQDGLKANRSIVDRTATEALNIMSDVLSTEGTNDFTKKVNALKVQKATEKSSRTITKAEYISIIDEVADGKLIDGKSASEWLFSQSVADTNGALGSYFGIVPSRVFDDFDQISFAIYGFERTKGEGPGMNPENGFFEIPVKVSLYDYSSKLIDTIDTEFQSHGVTYAEIQLLNKTQLSPGVYKVVGETTYEGKTLTGTSFGIYGSEDLRLGDNNIAFMLLNSDGTDINTSMEGKITVEGANEVNTQYIGKGLLIVECDRGDSITLKYGSTSVIYSKPNDTRVIPLKISE
jgi:hypothetical protein